MKGRFDLVILICSVLIIVLFEIGLFFTVNYFRGEFQWLITKADELPEFDSQSLEKFVKNSFDPYLGWARKPNTKGFEKGKYARVKFGIDAMGSRINPSDRRTDCLIAAFGDSYTFCRQANDNETWPFFLSRKLNRGVLNFGAGNYGVDQALLRYERTKLPKTVKIVILGFVPETICRIYSYWKHYLEFGNTFAFKPRFQLKDGHLMLFQNAMQSIEDFYKLGEKLNTIQKIDGFYNTKFRSLQFRFPYTVSYLRHSIRNSTLLYSLMVRKFARLFNRTSSRIENRPFKLIMRYNIKDSNKMYANDDACALLKAILLRFNKEAKRRGHKAIILVMPQLIDLENNNGEIPYKSFYQCLNREVTVLDITNLIMDTNFRKLYSEDEYGGHFSREGNEIIGQYLCNELRKSIPSELVL